MIEASIKIFWGIGFGKISTEIEIDKTRIVTYDVIFLFFRINVIKVEKIW